MNKRWIFLILVTMAVAGCDNRSSPRVPENVRITLDYAGRNYIGFLEAIVDYRKPEDSLKLQSLYHIIAHMPGHGYRTYLLQDTNGVLIDYNIRDHKNFKRLSEVRDSISLKHGKLHFIRHYYGKDVIKVDSRYLKNLVEESISIWKSNEWSKYYDFDVFKEKILPKRFNSGPFDDWQTIIRDSLLTKLQIKTDNPLVVADMIYRRLRGFLKWDERYIENPTDQGWQEMKKHRSARTEDAAVLLLAALRSYGIAAAIDYIPLPTESKQFSTYWVVVWDADGYKKIYYPFGDTLPEPSVYPKVFRRTYHSYHRKLYIDSVYRVLKYHHLETSNYKDVTDEYTNTASLGFGDEVKPVHDFSKVFLCFENDGSWIPVAWTYYADTLFFNKLSIGQRYALTDKFGNILYEMSDPVKITKD